MRHATLAEVTSRAFRGWVGTLATALEAEGRTASQAHALATLIIATIEGTIVMAKAEHSTEPIATTRELLNTLLDPATLPET